ncbi:MAG: nucleotidyltransferase domain-containing protein [Candidatus Poribacteria bacterium]
MIADMNLIREMARFIKERFSPYKIMLFGSYAYGKPSSDSDIDLLIIMNTSFRFHKQAAIIRLALDEIFGVSFPMDIIVRDQDEVEERLKQGDFFIKEILEEGIAL